MQPSLSLRLCALIPLFILITSCSNDPYEPPKFENQTTFKYSFDGNVTSLDPLKSGNNYSSPIVNNIFDTLYTYKYLSEPLEIKPNLAAELPIISDDLLTYTINLKKGVRFHDSPAFINGQGREVLASDFVYSLKRHFDPQNTSSGKWLWQNKIKGLDEWADNGADYSQSIPGLMATGPHQIQIQLIRPYPQLIYTLAMAYSSVVPQEAVNYYEGQFGTNPVGSGPFIFVSLNDVVAKLRKNDDFRAEPVDIYEEGYDENKHLDSGVKEIHGLSPPFVDHLEFHFIKDTSARWLSFTKSTEIDFTTLPKIMHEQALVSVKPLKLKNELKNKYLSSLETKLGLVFVGFNMSDPTIGFNKDPIINKRNRVLRCAIRAAYNWEMINSTTYANTARIFNGVIPPGVPEFNSVYNVENLNDIEYHNKQLMNAGWNNDNLPDIAYHYITSITHKQLYDLFKDFLNQLNYPAGKIKAAPHASFSDFIKSIRNKNAQVFFMEWSLDFPDVENSMQIFYGPNSSPGANFFNYSNLDFDELFEKAAYIPPSPKRTALFEEMNDLVNAECPIISGISRQTIMMWHSDWNFYPGGAIRGGSELRYIHHK